LGPSVQPTAVSNISTSCQAGTISSTTSAAPRDVRWLDVHGLPGRGGGGGNSSAHVASTLSC
jgi:hypothetical protein